MRQLRDTICARPRLAVLLLALALAMKALVPAGYMPGSSTVVGGAKVLTVQLCLDTLGKTMTTRIVIPHDGQADHAKSEGGCTFSALSMASLAGADPALLVLALAFILALGFAAQAPPFRERHARLRPPLRGPPLFA